MLSIQFIFFSKILVIFLIFYPSIVIFLKKSLFFTQYLNIMKTCFNIFKFIRDLIKHARIFNLTLIIRALLNLIFLF